MADAQKVLDEAIEEFETKARGYGRLDELMELAKLAFEAGEAMRDGKPVSDARASAVLHPGRSHPEHLS